jgi:hypothetical protein
MSRNAPKTRKGSPAPRGAFVLSARWAAALLAMITVLLFHQVIFGGMTFSAPDATAPVGFVRMGELALYHDHVYPLWNPFVFLGMPSFASGAYNPLIYPPDWPLALVAKVVPLPELTWLLLYYFLGGLFFFLLAREWGARPEGALLGAVALMFGPNLVAVGSHGHGSQMVNSAYLPLLLWLAARWMRRGGLHHLGWLALAGGFQMLRGHAQIAFYTWVAVGLYVAVEVVAGVLDARAGRATRPVPTLLGRAAAIGAAMALAFGMAGFYNLPLRDYARYSIRGGGAGGGVGMEYATAWSLAPWELPTIVIPGAVGFGGATYWGGMPFTDYPNAYVGMITVALALPALLTIGRLRVYALVLAGLALLIAMGRYFPLYGLLYEHLPLFNKFRVPVMILVLFQLAAALGLAWGWSGVLEPPVAKPRDRIERWLFATGAVLVVLLVMATVGRDGWRSGYLAAVQSHRPDLPPQAGEAAFAGFVGDLLRVALFGLAAVAAALLAHRRRLSATVASGALLLLLLGELWPVSAEVMHPVIGPYVPQVVDQGRDDVVEFLEKAGPPGSFRVWPVEELRSNRYAGFGVASIGGYHAAKPRAFQDLADAGLVPSPDHPGENPYWLRLLNVRYIVTQQQVDDPRFHVVFHGSGNVIENPDALPRATLVTRYRVAASPRAILDSIAAGREDSARLTWLEHDPGLTLGPGDGGRATITRYRLNDVTVDVDAPAPALLRLADLWYPDWKAAVDGRPAEILRADYLLRAVPVPAGRHQVEFRFESKSVKTGFLLSIVSAALALALIAAGVVFARRKAAAGAAS